MWIVIAMVAGDKQCSVDGLVRYSLQTNPFPQDDVPSAV